MSIIAAESRIDARSMSSKISVDAGVLSICAKCNKRAVVESRSNRAPGREPMVSEIKGTPMETAMHDVVAAALKNAGLLADGHPVHRTILVSNGYYAGQKFRNEGGYAIWLADADEIKVYDENGTPINHIQFCQTDAAKAA
jgi:hypothetical protein